MEQAQVHDAATRVALAPGSVLMSADLAHDVVFVIATGHVEQLRTGDVRVFGPGDHVGFFAVLTHHAHGVITALDEVVAWQIPRPVLLGLMAGNARFSAMVLAELSRQLSADEDDGRRREFLSLMTGKVRDAHLRKPFFVDGSLDLVSVCRLLSENGLANALVRDGQGSIERIGMFTTTDLRDALLRPDAPSALAVREVAQFELVSVDADAELFEALLLMMRHRVHRVLVRQGTTILGILSQLDLISFVANHSHLIGLRVDQAQSVEELQVAMGQLEDMIALLHRDGVRIDIISGLVSELNSRALARLWRLVAPVDLVRNSCLVVMGSEGRGEQVLKTDQDNALLLRDGYVLDSLADVTARFGAALLSFGYPPCPGHVMVSNPQWCQQVTPFRERMRGWMYGADADGPMNLAIFMDARAVAGDAALLHDTRAYAFRILADSDAFFARFVRAVDQFGEASTGWWSRLTAIRGREPRAFDLKKLGTFPIVHGVRALALEHHLDELGTVARLHALANRDAMPADLVRDLVEALHFLMTLKLRNSLRQRRLGQLADNLVQWDSLGTLDRDQLKDSLAIISRFRQHLTLHFKLEA
jgi:CBS domain-containing protein